MVSGSPRITGWELTVGNANQKIETIELFEPDEDEEDVLSSLMEHMRKYQNDNTILHTFHKSTIKLLRFRLCAAENSKSVSTQGFRYVAIRELLEIFGPWWREILEEIGLVDGRMSSLSNGSSLTSEDLWEIRRHVAPFAPLETMQGRPL